MSLEMRLREQLTVRLRFSSLVLCHARSSRSIFAFHDYRDHLVDRTKLVLLILFMSSVNVGKRFFSCSNIKTLTATRVLRISS